MVQTDFHEPLAHRDSNISGKMKSIRKVSEALEGTYVPIGDL
ncbi:hypothetical protein [Paenibacillus sp. GSMTC-2017]|nr:hypothetical protein [Paenibacillus sp. GSMTC-2017]